MSLRGPGAGNEDGTDNDIGRRQFRFDIYPVRHDRFAIVRKHVLEVSHPVKVDVHDHDPGAQSGCDPRGVDARGAASQYEKIRAVYPRHTAGEYTLSTQAAVKGNRRP